MNIIRNLIGYEQAQVNAKILKDAYIGDNKSKLFISNEWSQIDKNSIYFRSDDEERTLLTAQTFVSKFFRLSSPDIVEWHTADDILDPIGGSYALCPLLTDISKDVFSSKEFISYNLSEGKMISDLGNSIFGAGEWSNNIIFDCLMTTICSEREVSNTPGLLTEESLDRIVQYSEEVDAFRLLYNNSQFAKHFSAQFMTSIISKITGVVENSKNAIKFAVYGKFHFIT